MNAEILTIGDEILIGQIVNTNSVWIAQQLNHIGIRVQHMASVADDENAIVNAFNAASGRADFVFVTGGLGPTKDDITKKVFASYFNAELVRDEATFAAISEYFSKRGRSLNELNSLQAMVPKGCTVIRNHNGTAPGMWMKKGVTVFVSMPGVPYEMKAMMTESVLPKITAENKLPHIFHKTVLTQGIGESAIAEMIEDWENALAGNNIKLAYLPQTGQVRLRLSSFGEKKELLEKNISNAIEELKPLIGKYIFGYEEYGEEPMGLEKVISELLRERKETLCLAESCTGGYTASLITSIAGASEVFKGCIVPYTNVAKHELLQVDEKIFTTVGSVSRDCVEQLAQNVRKKFNATYSIAISGIAGPTGATPEKPVGTVWIAVASEKELRALKFQFGDHRQRNIISSSQAALNMLRRLILKEF